MRKNTVELAGSIGTETVLTFVEFGQVDQLVLSAGERNSATKRVVPPSPSGCLTVELVVLRRMMPARRDRIR
jgi:hypothetical protein